MRKYILLQMLITAFAMSLAGEEKALKAPYTKAQDIVENLHGTAVADPYRWLEDQEHPDVRAWIEAQNKHTEAVIGKSPLRAVLKKEMAALSDIEHYETPWLAGDAYIYLKRRPKDDLSIIWKRDRSTGKEEILIDPHPMSDDNSLSVTLMDVDSDGSRLIYGIRKGGEDQLVLRVFDVAKKQDLPDSFTRDFYFSATFHPDGKGVVYTNRKPEGPRIFYHKLGTAREDDRLIFGDNLPQQKLAFPYISDNGKHMVFLVLEGSSGNRDIYYQSMTPGSPIQEVVNAGQGYFSPILAGDRLLLQTNVGAPHSKVIEAPLNALDTDPKTWKTIIDEHKDASITSVAAVGGKLFVNYMENVVTRLAIFDAQGKSEGTISFPSIGNVTQLTGKWSRNDAFFSFSSVHVSDTIYHYDVAKGKKTVWDQPKLPISTDDLVLEQKWFTSKDGTRVPMFLLHRKDLKLDGNNPAMVYGYGGFRANLGPSFSGRGVLWAKHGGVYAMVNLRGGAEFGERWHQEGMLDKKQNTFDDCYAATQYLIDQKYTNPERLCVAGGSNGGLLVGAAITQRPDLYKAAACMYPLLDMVRFHKFLMGPYWISEYGSADEPDQFPFIYAYSPYHNVKKGTKYPATIFVTGDADTRVAPLHARKMAAIMQANQGGDAPILLQYDTKAGHVAGGSKDHALDNASLWLSFLMDQLGMK